MFFSLSKTSFLKPNTNIQHKNSIINMESTYLVQPIVNGKDVEVALHRHFTSYRFSLKRPQLSPIKALFAVLFLSFSRWNYTSFSEIIFTWKTKRKTKKEFLKKQALNSTDNLQTTGFQWEEHNQICICNVISFFASSSKITFTFMWWEKQGKVYVGTLKAAATSKSGSALPK